MFHTKWEPSEELVQEVKDRLEQERKEKQLEKEKEEEEHRLKEQMKPVSVFCPLF